MCLVSKISLLDFSFCLFESQLSPVLLGFLSFELLAQFLADCISVFTNLSFLYGSAVSYCHLSLIALEVLESVIFSVFYKIDLRFYSVFSWVHLSIRYLYTNVPISAFYMLEHISVVSYCHLSFIALRISVILSFLQYWSQFWRTKPLDPFSYEILWLIFNLISEEKTSWNSIEAFQTMFLCFAKYNERK